MSENHVPEQLSESGPQSNGVTESNTDDAYEEDQVEHVDLKDEVLGETEDGKSTDTARDDMFVDCPDDLKEEEAAVEENEDDREEENNVLLPQESHFVELENSADAGQLKQLRLTLEKAVAEKESSLKEYQEERETVASGVFDLHNQLKALTSQQSLGNEDGVKEVTDVPLREMIEECLEFVKTASEERLSSEGSIRNLQELLSVKDSEIENLNAKVAQLTSSNESLLVSSEAQLEKDHNIDIVIDNTISSLATVVNQEQVLDNSISGKLICIERSTALLIERNNQMLSEIYQLGQSLSEVGLDTREQEYGNILVDARGGLLELKRKEEELVEKLSHLEDENRKLVEELDKERAMIGTLNTEFGNMKVELEHEKAKCASTKEKLSMAVTKGKALVQQRDSLKMSLADKSNELEKCLIELQEKSTALEASELTKEELTRSDNMVASLQNSLLQNNTIFEQVEEILSHAKHGLPEMSDMPERLRWLVDDRNTLKASFMELCKLKEALSLVDLPEPVSSSDLESQMNWLTDSFHKARHDMYVLQEEISTIKEASLNYIDHLSLSLLLELQEKYYLQSELTDLSFEYEVLVGKNHHISLEKDQIMEMLVDFSGLSTKDEGINQFSSNTMMIIDLCFQNIKGQNDTLSRESHIDPALFEGIQSLLYVRDQALMLYEDLLEEDMLIRSDVSKLSNELKVASEEIIALKEERSSLLKDLERSEEKTSMLRDKLSMAVKKGKGLVQDRDNLKGLLNEKNSEIEQLKVDLQKLESAVSDHRDEVNRLSSDVGSIPKLEADLLEIKRERDQFEQFLMESNNMSQRVVECLDGIVLPVDPVFGEPIEKVKWLVGYVSECQDTKVHIEKELQLVKEEVISLEIKLAEAQENVNSLEQRLSSSEDTVSQLAEEKAELEHGKARVEEELEKVREKVAEVCSTSKSLEDALSQAEKDISVLSEEKEQAQAYRDAAETELERVKDEAARQTSELAVASRTIKDLEDELSQVESKVNLLTETYNDEKVVKTDMESELKKLQDEATNNASKLVGASATIKSLEDALLKAQDDISALEDANKIAKQEISSLSSKLTSYMDEFAGKNDSLENKSLELVGILNDLRLLMKDDTLFLRIKECFERKCETLKNIDLILSKIRNTEEDPPVRKAFFDGLKNFEVELDNVDINGTDVDTLISSFEKIVKGFQLRSEHIANKFDELSDSVDEQLETNIMALVEEMEIMKERVNATAKLNEEKDNIIVTLENDISVLLSACTDSTSELQNEVDKNLGLLGSNSEVENHTEHEQAGLYKNSKCADASRNLISTSRKVQTFIKQFGFESEQVAATIGDLQNKLNESTTALELVTNERDLNENKVLQLESDVQLLHHACSELEDKLEGFRALEDKLKDKEVEISSMRSALLAKEESEQVAATIGDLQNKLNESTTALELVTNERDVNKNKVLQLESDVQLLRHACSELEDKLEGFRALEDKLKDKEVEISSMRSALLAKEEESSLLSASQVRDLFDKIDRIKIPIVESEEEDAELHISDPRKKLFYIIDSVTKFHNQINSLSHDQQEMQSMLDTKVLEIKDLKEEVKQLNRNCEDSKMVKNELSELMFVFEKIIEILGSNNWVVDRKFKSVKELVPALEKHILSILSESENSKSKAQELDIKLVGSQKVIDELATKVKLLEDSLQDRISQPDIVQERSLFKAPSLPAGSEITEVEEGSLGKKTLSPVPSAAHVRNMRKGSTDHLALDINVESDHLINRADTDVDKGHVFKSLNTSGFVPKQGKLIADRIDGIWVSGSGVLMSRPRARLGLIGYLLIMHLWLLVTIL